jgi:4-methyl-5(b-hydroxyethyl)-thiazole monophosphate biosynthesis
MSFFKFQFYFHMKKVFIFLAEGFEETEAVTAIDVLRRGRLDVASVSISGKKEVVGAHGILVVADQLFEETDFSAGTMLVLPGGMPGASNLNAHAGLKTLLKQYAEAGKYIAAICAAPLVLGGMGLLQGKRATCYPGFESTLEGAFFEQNPVVREGNILTGRGPGLAVHFGLAIVDALQGGDESLKVGKEMLFI